MPKKAARKTIPRDAKLTTGRKAAATKAPASSTAKKRSTHPPDRTNQHSTAAAADEYCDDDNATYDIHTRNETLSKKKRRRNDRDPNAQIVNDPLKATSRIRKDTNSSSSSPSNNTKKKKKKRRKSDSDGSDRDTGEFVLRRRHFNNFVEQHYSENKPNEKRRGKVRKHQLVDSSQPPQPQPYPHPHPHEFQVQKPMSPPPPASSPPPLQASRPASSPSRSSSPRPPPRPPPPMSPPSTLSPPLIQQYPPERSPLDSQKEQPNRNNRRSDQERNSRQFHEENQEGEMPMSSPETLILGAPDTASDVELTSTDSSMADESESWIRSMKVEVQDDDNNCGDTQQQPSAQDIQPASTVFPPPLCSVKEVLDSTICPKVPFEKGEVNGLPGFPNFMVDKFGVIPLPLIKLVVNSASKLLARLHDDRKVQSNTRQLTSEIPPTPMEITPSEFTVGNPKWDGAVDKLANRLVVETLGQSWTTVHAQIEKILLWGEHSALKGQEDDGGESGDDMAGDEVAKLIIQCPSDFSGGSFLVGSGGHQYDCPLTTGSEAMTGYQFLFYSPHCTISSQEMESGVRLTIHYSVRRDETTMGDAGPNSCRRDFNAKLESALASLPKTRSLFIYPLNFVYGDTATLQRSCLHWKDRVVETAIAMNRRGEWKTMLGILKVRQDSEPHPEGRSSFPIGNRLTIQVNNRAELEGNDLSFVQAIESLTTFDSYEDGGIVLLPRDTMREAIQALTSQHGQDRKRTVGLMIAFSKTVELELLCHHHFPSAVSKVVGQPILLDQLYSILRTTQVRISVDNAATLLEVLSANSQPLSFIQEAVRITLDYVEKDDGITEHLIISFLLLVSEKKFGWDADSSGRIKAYLSEHVEKFDGRSFPAFTVLFDTFLSLKEEAPCEFVDDMIQNIISSFDQATKQSKFVVQEGASDTKAMIDDMLEDLLLVCRYDCCDWETIKKPMIISFFHRLSKMVPNDAQQLLYRLDALNRVCTKEGRGDLGNLKETIVDAILRLVALQEDRHENDDDGGDHCDTSATICCKDVLPFLPHLIYLIKEHSWSQLKDWISNSTMDQCIALHNHSQKILVYFADKPYPPEYVSVVSSLEDLARNQVSKLLRQALREAEEGGGRGGFVVSFQNDLESLKSPEGPSLNTLADERKINPELVRFLRGPNEGDFAFQPQSEKEENDFLQHFVEKQNHNNHGDDLNIECEFSVKVTKTTKATNGMYEYIVSKSNQINDSLQNNRYRRQRDDMWESLHQRLDVFDEGVNSIIITRNKDDKQIDNNDKKKNVNKHGKISSKTDDICRSSRKRVERRSHSTVDGNDHGFKGRPNQSTRTKEKPIPEGVEIIEIL